MKQIVTSLSKICGIYMLINTANGKRYIGSSIDIKRRLWGHRACLRHNHHGNQHLQKAWNKYGERVFEYSVLEICSPEERFSRELFYVDTLHPEYNICIEIVENPPSTIETRLKHSETRKRLMAEGIIDITHNRPVWVYNSTGTLVGNWKSLRQAATALKINYTSAGKVLNGKNFLVKGYKFFDCPLDYVLPFKKPTNAIISKCYIVDDGETKLEFIGVKAISEYFNTTEGNIRIHIAKKIKFHKKYMIYKKEP